jgi:hypothetical protein
VTLGHESCGGLFMIESTCTDKPAQAERGSIQAVVPRALLGSRKPFELAPQCCAAVGSRATYSQFFGAVDSSLRPDQINQP